jgi:NADPH-dependent curcumin reductase
VIVINDARYREATKMKRPENQQMRLVARPNGIPQPEHFALVTEPMPRTDDGQILVRNHYLSVDPAQRGWANDEGNYSAPVALNSPMRALAVGEVIESRAVGFPEGEFLYGWFGWQSYCAVTPDAVLRRVAPSTLPLSANLSLLGINGLTAYLALNQLGHPRPAIMFWFRLRLAASEVSSANWRGWQGVVPWASRGRRKRPHGHGHATDTRI